MQAGISFETASSAISAFGGVDRRFQHKASIRGIDFYDDYGHHPTEIRATLSALRERYPDNRLVVLFQPHRFTRTQSLWNEFAQSFDHADQVYILDIYPAGEAPIAGVSSELILEPLKKTNKAAFALPSPVDLSKLSQELRAGDIVLTLGAGDVWKVGEQLLETNVPR